MIFFAFILLLVPAYTYGASSTYTYVGITNPTTVHKATTGTITQSPLVNLVMNGTNKEGELNNVAYSSISADVVLFAHSNTNVGEYPTMDFDFKINEATANITSMIFHIEGYGCRGNPCGSGVGQLEFWLWDITNSTWGVKLGAHTNLTETTVSSTISSGFSNYVTAGGSVTLRAFGPRRTVATGANNLNVDFIKTITNFNLPASDPQPILRKNYGITFGRKPKAYGKQYVPYKEPEIIDVEGG